MISSYFQKKQQEQPVVVETSSVSAEPLMTRAQHWDAINAERKAKKAVEAQKPQSPVVSPKPKTKTGAFGTSRLKK
jgi:hypothetical protein